MALRGYLAGIFRSVDVEVDGGELHQLLSNPNFDAAIATPWDTTGTVSREAGNRYGQGSYAELAADATLEQLVELDSALAAEQEIVVRCWADADDPATLTVTFEDALTVLDTASLTIGTSHDNEVNGWGLWSMRVTAPAGTVDVTFNITAGAGGGVDVDDCETMFVEQISGATGELTSSITVETADVTTFQSAQENNGFRSHLPTLHNGEQMSVRAFHLPEDENVLNIVEGQRVFVQLYVNVDTNDRWEFFAYATGLTGSFPIEGARETNITLTIDGPIGFTGTTAS